jgi:hypothetical protein
MRRAKHSVGVDRLGRDRLADVPQLDDAIALEAEEMHEGCPAVVGCVLNARMHDDQIALLERMQHIKPLVRILACVFFHAGHQRLSVSGEKRVVVPEVVADVLLVHFANTAGSRMSEKRDRHFFSGCHAIVHGRWLPTRGPALRSGSGSTRWRLKTGRAASIDPIGTPRGE